MNVAIVGFETEGRLSYEYWKAKGAAITICDQDPDKDIPQGVPAQLGDGYLQHLEEFDVIVRSAGINPNLILAANAGVETKITTAVNEFLRVCPTKNVIGITGTKGKGTTSTLVASILETAGKKVFLGGNIGVPPFAFLQDLTHDSWVVLELSSFQLTDLAYSPHIGICLMVVPEHLNWHKDMDDYIKAKSRLFAFQKPADTAIYYADNEISHTIASASPGAKIPYYAEPGAYIREDAVVIDDQEICKTDEIQLLGQHNLQNVCAAVTAAWQATKDVEAIRTAIISFKSLPHRLEPVREVAEVRYYNDSFGSVMDATEAAVKAIPGPKVLIVGGFDRYLPLEHFAGFLKSHEKEVPEMLLIGQSAQRLSEELDKVGFKHYRVSGAATMKEIVSEAQGLAKPGDAVLLSPGFPSFDMFKNFEERGNLFKQEVRAL